MQDFRKLAVWEKSFRLGLDIYQVSKGFPKDELFGLTSQLRRASVSISANIAEGCGRFSSSDLVRFLDISMGSVSEVDTYLDFARELGYLDAGSYDGLQEKLVEVRRMLIALIQTIRSTNEH